MAQTITPRNGDIFIGAPGAVLNGADQARHAFDGEANGVAICGLIVENYANPAQSGAIHGGGSDWVISGNEIRYNLGGGITLQDGFQVTGNNVHHNRQIGLKGRGAGILIQDNELAFNNYLDEYSMSWEAGGAKFLKTTTLVVRGNYVHDNHGHGLWTDADNVGTLYEDNVVVDNHGSGIFHEISYDAIIRNNEIVGNAYEHSHGGIKITSSTNVEVYENTLTDNNGGIHAAQNDRGSGSHGAFEVTGLWVHHNTIGFGEGWSGLLVTTNVDAFYTDMGNHFDRNAYILTGDEPPFYWMYGEIGSDAWQSHGLDPNGTFS